MVQGMGVEKEVGVPTGGWMGLSPRMEYIWRRGEGGCCLVSQMICINPKSVPLTTFFRLATGQPTISPEICVYLWNPASYQVTGNILLSGI